jgi:hypothetical protein
MDYGIARQESDQAGIRVGVFYHRKAIADFYPEIFIGKETFE